MVLPPAETIGELLEDLKPRRVSLDFFAEEFRLLAAAQDRQHAILGYRPAMRSVVLAALRYYVQCEEVPVARKGAPTKRTPEVRRLILDALNAGATRREAAAAAGVSYDFLNDWCNELSQFSHEVGLIEISHRMKQLKRLQRQRPEPN